MASLLHDEFVDELRIDGINYKGYGIIPKFVMLDTDLTIESKGIYAYFCSYAGSGNTAFPGWEKIVHDLKINKDSYYKHYKLLLENGYLTVEQQNNGGRGQGFSKNIYTIVSNPPKFDGSPKENSQQKAYSTIKAGGLKAAGFGFIPKAAMTDPRLSIKAKALYAYYCSFSGAGESACPKKDIILHHLNISANSFVKYNKELTSLNFINVVQHYAAGRLSVNEYQIIDKPDMLNSVSHQILKENQYTKISESQISEPQGLQQTKFSEPQKQETQIQEVQNSEANKNKKTNNKNKNNNPDNQQRAHTMADEKWDDESLALEIIKEKGIPASVLENPRKLEAAVKLICNYKRFSDRQRYERFEDGDFQYSSYMLFVDALISMLSNSKERKVDERTITNETVREKLARYIRISKNGEVYLESLIEDTRSLYEAASAVTSPGRPLNFMQRMIWNAMVNGTIITDTALMQELG